MIPLSYDSAVFERLFEKRTSRHIRDICENIEGYESVAQGEMIDEKNRVRKSRKTIYYKSEPYA
jgi:hypothetical protein